MRTAFYALLFVLLASLVLAHGGKKVVEADYEIMNILNMVLEDGKFQQLDTTEKHKVLEVMYTVIANMIAQRNRRKASRALRYLFD